MKIIGLGVNAQEIYTSVAVADPVLKFSWLEVSSAEPTKSNSYFVASYLLCGFTVARKSM